MPSSGDLNRTIVTAASLAERIASGVYHHDAAIDDRLADTRLALWRRKSAQDNDDAFFRRLAWDRLDIARARLLLGADPLQLDPEPFWAPVLRDLLAFLAAPHDAPPCSRDEHSLNTTPFAHALLPLAQFGMAALQTRVPTPAPPLFASLTTGLLDRLAEVCALTLGEEFLRFRRARAWSPGEGQGRNDLYSSFTAGLAQDGLSDVLTRYPALARLVAITVAHWVDAMAEFLLRLHADLPEIAARFFGGVHPGEVRSMQGALSDPHCKGRTVVIVSFDRGRIVYKPKSLAIDEAWMRLIAWLRQRDPALQLRTPNAWDRGLYGWAEFIEAAPCQNLEAIRDFYRRAGMLTCLLYVVMATDFHHENLIACAEHPVPIDLETLFVPRFQSRAAGSDRLARRFFATVLQSLMLPAWRVGADRLTPVDTSGLGGSAQEQDAGTGLIWTHINTDAMQFSSGRATVKPSCNLPSLPSTPVDPAAFLPQVLDGFATAYRALMRHRGDLLSGPLESFRHCYSRIVPRPTQTYAALLRRSLAPRLLRNGIDRSLEFEALSAAMLLEPDHGPHVFQAERHALEQLDIPYFDALAGGDAIRAGDHLLPPGMLAGPSFLEVAGRLRDLSDDDLEFQAELIRTSFAARDRGFGAASNNRPANPVAEPASDEILLAGAEAIAARIARRAIWHNTAAWWIAPEYIPAIDRYALQPIGPSLYSGRGGIALFFAALAAVTGNPEYRRVALGAARSIVDEWLDPALDPESVAFMARSQGIGAATGAAGVVYALTAAARLLQQPDLLDDALRVSRFLTPADIQADTTLDIIAGAAGAIVGLLPLWRETRDPVVLDRILHCAEHLVAAQMQDTPHAGGWMHARFQRPLTGFSHGAAGIAFALLHASAATGLSHFHDAALRGIRFERSVFVPSENSWPDFRPGRDGKFGVSWCHGAPGIGLARLGALPFHTGDESLREIDAALQWLLARPPVVNDHLCCGEFGNLELLLEAGRRLDKPELTLQARLRAASAIARARRSENGAPAGFQSILGPCDPVFLPGLFDGLAGIGYQMLRLAFPHRVPSVLLWE